MNTRVHKTKKQNVKHFRFKVSVQIMQTKVMVLTFCLAYSANRRYSYKYENP